MSVTNQSNEEPQVVSLPSPLSTQPSFVTFRKSIDHVPLIVQSDSSSNSFKKCDASSTFSLEPQRLESSSPYPSPSKDHPTIRCLYTNATSLNAEKLDELSAFSLLYEIKVIVITETWFTDSSIFQIENFSCCFHKEREGEGGGVAVYVHNDLEATELSDISLRKRLEKNDVEQTWCQLGRGSESILLGVIYRPPLKYTPVNFEEEQLVESLRTKSDSEKHIGTANAINSILSVAKSAVEKKQFGRMLVLGDFNYPSIKWHKDGSASVQASNGRLSSLSYDFWKTTNDLGLVQCITEPTFIKASMKPTNVLDLLLTDDPGLIGEITMGPPLGHKSQGHKTIFFEINRPFDKTKVFSSFKFDYRRGNYYKLSENISKVNWFSVLSKATIDEAYVEFLNRYEQACKECIPPKKPRTVHRPPWFNSDIEKLVKNKRSLWHANQRVKWKSTALFCEYKQARNELSKRIRSAVRTHELSIAKDKSNPRRLFAYANSKQSSRNGISAIKDLHGETQTDPKAMANALNEQFSSVFTRNTATHPDFDQRSFDSALERVSFDAGVLSERLAKLDRYKSRGADGVSPYVLKECSTAFAIPLFFLFERSISEGVLPNAWREANVTPLFKKGSRLDPSNYRPISLTSVVCKIMETFVRDSLVIHMLQNNLICKQQHGFVPRRSCATNLLETIDFLTLAMSEKTPTDVIFLDFAKAFDKVSHRALRIKLEGYGIQGQVLNWIMAFLSERRQRVVLGESTSDWSFVHSGVPQGSVLGPILFVVFINDLPLVVKHAKCKLYADDCKLLATIKDENDSINLQRDIDEILKWCCDWQMQLNYEKCRVMHCGKKNRSSTYKFLNEAGPIIIEKSVRERDLGIILTPDLKWHEQTTYVAGKASRMLGLLKKTFRTKDEKVWKKLYNSYIRPLLEFSTAVWNPYHHGDIELLERFQRRVTKYPRKLRNMSYEERLKRLNLTSLKNRRHRFDLTQLFKIISGYETVNFEADSSGFVRISAPRAGKRAQLRREVIKSCDQRHKFFYNRIVKGWNKLPDKTVASKSVNGFKKRLNMAMVTEM